MKPDADEVTDHLALAEALASNNNVVARSTLTPARVDALRAFRDPFRWVSVTRVCPGTSPLHFDLNP